MSPETLTAYLHRSIPLTAAMKLAAESVSIDRVVLRCPLGPNVNHHQTAFGGSISAALMLAGWAMMRVRMGAEGLLNGSGLEWSMLPAAPHAAADAGRNPRVKLVVSKSATEFLHPIEGDFCTECRFEEDRVWARFVERFRASDWAKLRLQATVPGDREPLAKFKGTYVAVRGNGPADQLATPMA